MKPRRSGAPRQVRIIGGQWKRTPLAVLDAEGLRPTPDRVRETVFNWLEHLFDHEWDKVRCLDLYAGSGALGFEAVRRGDAMANAEMLARSAQKFDLIFLDPPYHQDILRRMLPVCLRLLAPDGLLYVEAETALDAEPQGEWLQDWRSVRTDRAGMVFYHLFMHQRSA
jgi:16S rRNA (guanine966-N2)-methyltransferase